MDFVRLSVFRPVGRKLPGPGLQIDLIPSAACHLFPALTSQRQDFDDVAVGSADLSRSEDDFGKLAIAQHPIPGHLFAGSGTPSAGERSRTARPMHQRKKVLIAFSALLAATGAPRCSMALTTSITSRLRSRECSDCPMPTRPLGEAFVRSPAQTYSGKCAAR